MRGLLRTAQEGAGNLCGNLAVNPAELYRSGCLVGVSYSPNIAKNDQKLRSVFEPFQQWQGIVSLLFSGFGWSDPERFHVHVATFVLVRKSADAQPIPYTKEVGRTRKPFESKAIPGLQLTSTQAVAARPLSVQHVAQWTHACPRVQ